MLMKECPDCQQTKSHDEFYINHNTGNPYKYCKECAKKRAKKYTKAYKARKITDSGVQHEQQLINKLKSLGFYACSGKKSRSRWVDIVVFGCIAVEAKLARKKRSAYGWTFSPKQVRDGIRGEIVVFMIQDGNTTDYYVLHADEPVLYRDDGQLKPYISYSPNSSHGRTNKEMLAKMKCAKNNFQLIADIFRQKTELLKQGETVVHWTD